MIENPRDDYMGRIHLVIKDKETGAIFELQIGSKNITDFIEKTININYGLKEQVNKNGTITYLEDKFNSNIYVIKLLIKYLMMFLIVRNTKACVLN